MNSASKGVTPIVSVVLLLLMTIALAGGVMVYLTGYTSGLQSDITLKDTFCSRNNDNNVTMRIRVQNIASSGDITLTSSDYTMLSGPKTSVTFDQASAATETVTPGQQKLIVLFVTNSTTGGMPVGTYVLDIATDRGAARGSVSCS